MVFARLILDEGDVGVHNFIVPIRDMDSHLPLPGKETSRYRSVTRWVAYVSIINWLLFNSGQGSVWVMWVRKWASTALIMVGSSMIMSAFRETICSPGET